MNITGFISYTDYRKLTDEEKVSTMTEMIRKMNFDILTLARHFGMTEGGIRKHMSTIGLKMRDLRDLGPIESSDFDPTRFKNYEPVTHINEIITRDTSHADSLVEAEKRKAELYAQGGFNILLTEIMTGEELAEELENLARMVRKRKYLFNVSIQFDPLPRADVRM